MYSTATEQIRKKKSSTIQIVINFNMYLNIVVFVRLKQVVTCKDELPGGRFTPHTVLPEENAVQPAKVDTIVHSGPEIPGPRSHD